MKNKLSRVSNGAKRIGKAVNKVLEKYPSTALIPYVPQTVKAANMAVGAIDMFSELMQSFMPNNSIGHPGLSYGTTAGVANTLTVNRTKPKFRNSQGIVRLTHKELAFSVSMTTTLKTNDVHSTTFSSLYTVNPGNGTLFPWLATLGSSYDYYRFKRVRLVYVPLCGTSTTGRVMLGYDPDSTDALQLDRAGLSSYSCSSEGAPWNILTLDCDLSDNSKWYYQDNKATIMNSLLDQGQVFFATWGGANDDVVGEVYVLYEVELKDPQPASGLVVQSYGAGANPDTPFPGNFPIFNTAGSANTIVMKIEAPGVFNVWYRATATGAGNATITGGDGAILTTNQATNGADTTCGFVSVRSYGSCTLSLNTLTGLNHWTVYATRSEPFATYVY